MQSPQPACVYPLQGGEVVELGDEAPLWILNVVPESNLVEFSIPPLKTVFVFPIGASAESFLVDSFHTLYI